MAMSESVLTWLLTGLHWEPFIGHKENIKAHAGLLMAIDLCNTIVYVRAAAQN